MARFPFGIANSCSIVVYAGELLMLDYRGRERVLFRGDSIRAAVLDAYCPHLDAHLVDSQGSSWQRELEF